MYTVTIETSSNNGTFAPMLEVREYYSNDMAISFYTYIVREYMNLGNYELQIGDCVSFVNRLKTVKIKFKTIE